MKHEADKGWADQFIPHQKAILAQELIVEAPKIEDMKRNSDLVLKVDSVRVACRVRRAKWASDYPFEVTIRRSRPSNAKTEMRKLCEGWGDYMLYGFACPGGKPLLSRWVLLDLKRLRFAAIVANEWFMGWAKQGPDNRDGSSAFAVLNMLDRQVHRYGLVRAHSPGYFAGSAYEEAAE